MALFDLGNHDGIQAILLQ